MPVVVKIAIVSVPRGTPRGCCRRLWGVLAVCLLCASRNAPRCRGLVYVCGWIQGVPKNVHLSAEWLRREAVQFRDRCRERAAELEKQRVDFVNEAKREMLKEMCTWVSTRKTEKC